MRHIAFVCSGNICRSPMAEGIAREMLGKLEYPAEVSSAGTLGIVGQPAIELAVKAVFMLGIDVTEHRSRGLSPGYLQAASHVVVMEEDHARIAQFMESACAEKIVRLWEYTSEPGRLVEISDPIRGDLEVFVACRDNLLECLRNWVAELADVSE
ncbi:MAG: hypothetical protein O7J95_19425 [Planctomycetota bacterium]|nr:hypothetical protein [Planctomycetota bacterium]